MSRGEYRLAVQRANGAAFARVVVEAHETSDARFVVDASAVDEWRAGGLVYKHSLEQLFIMQVHRSCASAPGYFVLHAEKQLAPVPCPA